MKRRLLAVLALLVPACTDEAIVLATIPESASDGGAHPTPTKCVGATDCNEGYHCEKLDCHAVEGECQPAPKFCGNEERVECGCDGVSYFNSCFRRAAGVAELHDGECTSESRPCDADNPCPSGATCAVLLGFGDVGMCSGHEHGTCWVVPSTCPDPRTPDYWTACDPDAGITCASTCKAIATGKTYFRASHCPGP